MATVFAVTSRFIEAVLDFQWPPRHFSSSLRLVQCSTLYSIDNNFQTLLFMPQFLQVLCIYKCNFCSQFFVKPFVCSLYYAVYRLQHIYISEVNIQLLICGIIDFVRVQNMAAINLNTGKLHRQISPKVFESCVPVCLCMVYLSKYVCVPGMNFSK